MDTMKVTTVDFRMEHLPVDQVDPVKSTIKDPVKDTIRDPSRVSGFVNAQVTRRKINMDMKKPNAKKLIILTENGATQQVPAIALMHRDLPNIQAMIGPMKPATPTMVKSENIIILQQGILQKLNYSSAMIYVTLLQNIIAHSKK
jgi:hypothetical protein